MTRAFGTWPRSRTGATMRRAVWHSIVRGVGMASAVAGVAGGLLSSVAPRSVEAQGATTILDRVRVNPRRAIDFHAIVLPESVYVGQQATYQVAVLLSPDARSRLRRNPEFLPPELRGLLAYELGTPTRVAPRSYGGAVFEAHVFQRALFPVTDGRQVVPAPQLTYSLPQSASYFSREERYMVRAESAAFIVKPLPAAGRPEDFNGAVGKFTTSIRIDTTTARVGDPLVLTLRVQGTGNVKLLPRPNIELDWASVVPGTERIQVDSSGALVRGTKEFDWILTPARAGRVRIPALRYSFFDPYAARYALAESAPLEMPVQNGVLAAAEEGETSDVLPLRGAVDRAPSVTWSGRGRPPIAWWPWLLLAGLAPLPALAWSRRRREPARTASRGSAGEPTGTYPVSAADPAREALRTTRRRVLAALADRLGQSPQSLVSRDTLARALRRAGVTRTTTRELLLLLERLDEVGFADGAGGGIGADHSQVEVEATELLARVEREAMPRGRRIGSSVILVGLLTCGPALLVTRVETLAAQSSSAPSAVTMRQRPLPDSVRTALDAMAREAYERRAFGEAAQRFGALARLAPTDASVLVDWGTAAWAAGDTLSAVIAWQRAARLEPLAADVQQRIDLLPAGARGGVADVPMVPVPWLLQASLALWLVGWALLGWRAWRRRAATVATTGPGHADFAPAAAPAPARWLRDVAIMSVLLAIGGGGVAWWGMRALDASALAVVARPETLRIAPGTDADAMGGVTTGDVVRILETRDSWQRVRHSDGRRGWLPVVRLVAMNADPSARQAR